ncbi:MAG: AbaSI family restriction endonuclease [Bacteroidota bacterium]
MTKFEYIIRQIAKTNKKNYENYVVTRIFHLLNRTDVKFMTQQYVNRQGKYALTDMYFPQLKIHVEVDEPFHEKQKDLDVGREMDIIQATGHELFRIRITQNINAINSQVNELVDLLKERISNKEQAQTWEAWDLEKEFDPNYHRKKGYLEVSESPAFRKISDACNCLRQNYKGNVQGGYFKSKVYENHYLWFPKFYENEDWDNRISDDRTVIFERCKNVELREKWFDDAVNNPVKRITFPRSIDNLGFRLYKFAGIFETDFEESTPEKGLIHKLKKSRIEINSDG